MTHIIRFHCPCNPPCPPLSPLPMTSLRHELKVLQDFNLRGSNDRSANNVLPSVKSLEVDHVTCTDPHPFRTIAFNQVLNMLNYHQTKQHYFISYTASNHYISLNWPGTLFRLSFHFNIPNVYCQTILNHPTADPRTLDSYMYRQIIGLGYTLPTGKGWNNIVEVCAEVIRLTRKIDAWKTL